MPHHRYISKDVLFDDEEEYNHKSTRSKYDSHGRVKVWELRNQELMMRKEQVLQSTLESTKSALASLKESEDIGTSAALELDRQHASLKHTNTQLDTIKADLKVNQERISGMKSVLKGVKSYFTKSVRIKKRKDSKKRKHDDTDDVTETYTQKFEDHPATPSKRASVPPKDINKEIEDNLEEMATSVARLKDIGLAMGEDIEEQNRLLDEMRLKVDKADAKIVVQKKQVEKLIRE